MSRTVRQAQWWVSAMRPWMLDVIDVVRVTLGSAGLGIALSGAYQYVFGIHTYVDVVVVVLLASLAGVGVGAGLAAHDNRRDGW